MPPVLHDPATPIQSLYRGRFAPSPTGPLHFGSLITAVGSYVDARSHAGKWAVRIEDLDPPREQPGAADSILATLTSHGLEWDGPVLYQHTRLEAYAAAVERLLSAGLAYPCACSRREIADSAVQGLEGPVYPGTCRGRAPSNPRGCAIRLRVPAEETFAFTDRLQGPIHQHLAHEIGDFVIRRTDQYCAYQMAVVLDDAAQGITHVVRGADLLLSTPRQLYLQRLLGLRPPIYMHLPVAVHANGQKISKQTGSRNLSSAAATHTLFQALVFLGQRPPPELLHVSPEESLKWAVRHWDPAPLRAMRVREIDLDSILD